MIKHHNQLIFFRRVKINYKLSIILIHLINKLIFNMKIIFVFYFHDTFLILILISKFYYVFYSPYKTLQKLKKKIVLLLF